ncbi:MAG TPA: helix-turn-helix transcriptional regulator [Bradyrhizobium sp.]|nr:helix-turn-helix transcriptional regulator [Bradyrhizobium sp.]
MPASCWNPKGTTFTELALEERLLRAHRMLNDPLHAGRLISNIALAVGFGDISYFNRTFRRRFGYAPSETRATRWPTGA